MMLTQKDVDEMYPGENKRLAIRNGEVVIVKPATWSIGCIDGHPEIVRMVDGKMVPTELTAEEKEKIRDGKYI